LEIKNKINMNRILLIVVALFFSFALSAQIRPSDGIIIPNDGGIGNLNQARSFVPTPGKYVISGWVKEDVAEAPSSYEHSSIELSMGGDNINFAPYGAIIDGWQQIQGVFTIPGGTTIFEIKLRALNLGIDCYFDDVRVVPFDGNMKSFVYDPITQRLMAELDENNYATFYEYDSEGGLVRVKKETENGIYTIQETRSKTVIRN